MTAEEVIVLMKEKAVPANLAGMARFGINTSKAIGISIPELRKIAKAVKKDHELALNLWKTNIHEARIIASLIDDPVKVTPVQMDNWTNDFDSWDLCDQVCGNLFDRTPYAMEKALEYSKHEKEFVKRAGFVLMAGYAVHARSASNEIFIELLPVIEREAWDNRNFVKKAVNWALRQIGKRNAELRTAAIDCANRILQQNTKPARWIATNALNELV